ncbi:MAG: hypothetical protein FWE31_03140 [Firmicutes bacterium]|nr:hypothetical protein [Bacillota bacterium]
MKKNSAFQQLKTLMRLNSKLYARRERGARTDWVSSIFGLVITGLVLSAIMIFFSILVIDFEGVGAEYELLVFTLFVVLSMQIIWATVSCIKVFFSPTENNLLVKYPISGQVLFFSKFLKVFLRELVFGLAVMLPLLNVYGILLGFDLWFFILIPFVSILLSLFCFLVGALLSFPLVFLKSFLSNKFILTLIIFVAVSGIVFFGYMQVINEVFNITNTINLNVNSAIMDAIVQISAFVYPAILLSNMLFVQSFVASLFILLGIITALVSAVYLLQWRFYKRMLEKNAGSDQVYIGRATANIQRRTMWALIRREFINMFRNTGSLFQFFAFIIITPLVTYLTVESSTDIVTQNIGVFAISAIAFFIISVFCVIINSFAASAISREGDGFYLLKIYPLDYKKIVMSKVLFTIICMIPSIIVAVSVLAVFGLLSILEVFPVIIALAFLSVFQICVSIDIDLRSPKFADENGLVPSDRNTTLSISLGLAVCMILGVLSIIGAIYLDLILMFGIIIVITGGLAALGAFLLFRKLQGKFERVG